jgi:sugar lactone lactonase YvrE
VKDLGEKGGASDGLESDAQGRVYLSDYEHDAIRRRNAAGEIETLVHDPRVLWPDTLSLAADGYLYFTANQIERGAAFHGGQDLRQKPYVLFRVKVDGTRIQQ